MKKAIVLMLFVVMLLSTMAFAGPMIGMQVEPSMNSVASLSIGWDFGAALVEASKTSFDRWNGNWSIAALWTPESNSFAYRLGPKFEWKWKTDGTLVYKSTSIVIGVSKTWSAFQLFGQLDVGATGTLSVKPVLGFNVVFSGFFPNEETSEL